MPERTWTCERGDLERALAGEAPVTLIVDGPPVAAARGRATIRGNHATVYMPKGNVVYQDAVRVAWDRQRGPGLAFERGVAIVCMARFYFPRLAAHYGTGRNASVLKASAPDMHVVKPDADNCLKLALDALSGRAYFDDAQIAEVHMVKAYDVRPRTELEFWAWPA